MHDCVRILNAQGERKNAKSLIKAECENLIKHKAKMAFSYCMAVSQCVNLSTFQMHYCDAICPPQQVISDAGNVFVQNTISSHSTHVKTSEWEMLILFYVFSVKICHDEHCGNEQQCKLLPNEAQSTANFNSGLLENSQV